MNHNPAGAIPVANHQAEPRLTAAALRDDTVGTRSRRSPVRPAERPRPEPGMPGTGQHRHWHEQPAPPCLPGRGRHLPPQEFCRILGTAGPKVPCAGTLVYSACSPRQGGLAMTEDPGRRGATDQIRAPRNRDPREAEAGPLVTSCPDYPCAPSDIEREAQPPYAPNASGRAERPVRRGIDRNAHGVSQRTDRRQCARCSDTRADYPARRGPVTHQGARPEFGPGVTSSPRTSRSALMGCRRLPGAALDRRRCGVTIEAPVPALIVRRDLAFTRQRPGRR